MIEVSTLVLIKVLLIIILIVLLFILFKLYTISQNIKEFTKIVESYETKRLAQTKLVGGNTELDNIIGNMKLESIIVNDTIYTLPVDMIDNIKQSVSLISETSKNLVKAIKTEIKGVSVKCYNIFMDAINDIIKYVSKLASNPVNVLMKWLLNPSNLAELTKQSFKTTTQLLKSLASPSKVLKTWCENNLESIVVLLYTFYNSIIYSPVVLKFQNAFNKVSEYFKSGTLQLLEFLSPYIEALNNIVQSLFKLISPNDLRDFLNSCVANLFNSSGEDRFNKLKVVFKEYVSNVKVSVESIKTVVTQTFAQIDDFINNQSNQSYSIEDVDILKMLETQNTKFKQITQQEFK